MIKNISEILNIQVIIIIAITLMFGILIGYLFGKFVGYLEIKQNRTDAIKRSRNAILGEIYEKIMPFLNEFQYSPKDMVFVGKGFDYLILDGLNEGDLREIIFMEIKYGSSTLNKNEKMIRQTVGSKKVKYIEFKIPKL
ncbi:MAG: Holliday junction resolvase-like protein [Candidatus Gracilibacteria bacterium]|nr:Holliday junction resolvase-like protein [Candidatus Gracilibacteria bacterium]MDD2908548.1 Holliday junction resolvase-like protein [Candidatus Gracilibacteria bacterium]